MLTIALPKGRIAEDVLDIFEKLFNEKFEFENRKLILEKSGFKFLLVRNQDVPVYVERQAADLGVVGLDVLEEKRLDLLRLLDLKSGYCKVVVGIRDEDELDFDKPEIKIATKMVNITKRHFAKKAIAVDVIKLYGSIELAPLVGLCDAIVDITETGNTMKQNSLKVAETIMESTAHLICNKNSYYQKKSAILSLRDGIKELI